MEFPYLPFCHGFRCLRADQGMGLVGLSPLIVSSIISVLDIEYTISHKYPIQISMKQFFHLKSPDVRESQGSAGTKLQT